MEAHLIMSALSLEDAAFRTEKDVQDGKTDGTNNTNNTNNNKQEPATGGERSLRPQKKTESNARPARHKPPSKSDHKTERKKIELPKWFLMIMLVLVLDVTSPSLSYDSE
jgi:hypothetical protein